jgi:hypothetical protein
MEDERKMTRARAAEIRDFADEHPDDEIAIKGWELSLLAGMWDWHDYVKKRARETRQQLDILIREKAEEVVSARRRRRAAPFRHR